MKPNHKHILTSSLALLTLTTAMPLNAQMASGTAAAANERSVIAASHDTPEVWARSTSGKIITSAAPEQDAALSIVPIAATANSDGARAPAQAGDTAIEFARIADAYLEAVTNAMPFTVYFSLSDIMEPVHSAMPDNSPAALSRFNAQEDALYQALLGVEASGLVARGDWVAYQSMKEMMEANIGLRQCRLEGWNVSHMDGWQTAFTDIAARQPIATEGEREAALERWAKLPAYIVQQEQNLADGLANGYSAPKSVVRRVIGQLDTMLATPVEAHPFYAFAAKSPEAPDFQASMRVLVETAINPAIKAHRDFLRDRYLPAARKEIAISVLPGGRDCYEAMLRSYHSAEIGAERTYERGLETVEVRTEEAIARGEPLTGAKDLPSILAAINELPANRFSSEQELLEFTRAFIPVTREKTEPFFSSLPTAEMFVEPYPDFLKGTGQSSRYEADPGGNGAAIYRIQTDEWGTQTRGSAQITAVHEGYPGHHVQIATAFGVEGLHPITRLARSTAFIEGWARYSEALAEEAGLYADGYGEIIRRAWPARGMAIDAGVHVFGWSNERAIAYARGSGRFVGNSAFDLLDRIAVWPGQLTAYDTGGLEIIALRAQAEALLGDRFDIRLFHDRILENGAIPLGALRAHVEAWIAEVEAKQEEGAARTRP